MLDIDIKEMEEQDKVEEKEIVDLAWDENEDHVIVGFGNGAMAMLDFGGFDGQEGNWKLLYE